MYGVENNIIAVGFSLSSVQDRQYHDLHERKQYHVQCRVCVCNSQYFT